MIARPETHCQQSEQPDPPDTPVSLSDSEEIVDLGAVGGRSSSSRGVVRWNTSDPEDDDGYDYDGCYGYGHCAPGDEIGASGGGAGNYLYSPDGVMLNQCPSDENCFFGMMPMGGAGASGGLDDGQSSSHTGPRPPFFFQRLNSEEVVYQTSRKKPKFLGKYLMGEVLGEGSYGKVKEVLDSQTLVRRAVKIIKKRTLRRIPNGLENVHREIRLLHSLSHPNVIKLIEVLLNEEKEKMYLVLEYCLGGLQYLLEQVPDRKLPLWQAHGYFTQLIIGLEYLHGQGIIHKDIKPGNLLLTTDDHVKITDFGVAELLNRYSASDTLKTSEGTIAFQPPEVANGLEFSGSKLDVWSTGVTLYNITTGTYPFSGDTIFLLFESIGKGQFEIPELGNPDLRNLLIGMMSVDPGTRWSIADIKKCPWYNFSYPLSARVNKVEVPAERRQLSVIPYIESFLVEESMSPESFGAGGSRSPQDQIYSVNGVEIDDYENSETDPTNQNQRRTNQQLQPARPPRQRQSFWKRFNGLRKLSFCRQT